MTDIKVFVDKEYAKGNIVFSTAEGLETSNLKMFINQPTDGILYDLNRLEEVIYIYIDDPKWVNDFAVCKVIRELKARIEYLEKMLSDIK